MSTSRATDRLLAALRAHGLAPRPSGDGWMCRCPAHDDRTPSLSIRTGDDGRCLVKCHADCATADVVAAVGLTMRDLMPDDDGSKPSRRNGRAVAIVGSPAKETPPRPPTTAGSGQAKNGGPSEPHFTTLREAVDELERRYGPRSALWLYCDAAGEPVGAVVRWDLPNGSKQIRPVARDDAEWVLKGMTAPRPLYGLPELAAAPARSTIFVIEGEKAADAVRDCGLLATTSPHGSQAAAHADWSPLAGHDVVILPDCDDAGEKYAADAARLAAQAGARSVRVVRLCDRWPALPQGDDAADVLDLDGSEALREGLEALVADAEPATAEPVPIDGAPMIVRLSEVKPERVAWLWPGRIALGKVTLVAGDPGLGKSFVTLDMAARVSSGGCWPDRPDDRIEPGGVVLLSAEDGIADTIRPRLDAAGADVSRVVALEAIRTRGPGGGESTRAFDLSRDLPALESAIRSMDGCRLVVIDPITAYLGGVDSHKNADIRGLLAPLSAIAERHCVAVVAVTHLNKSGAGPAIYRAMGSLAFAAAARAAWAVTKDNDDPSRRLFLPIKNNIAADTGGLAYRIEPQGVDGCPVVVWEPDPVNVSADDALGATSTGDRGTALSEAVEWLRDLLSLGPVPAKEVKARAGEDGIASRTLDRAKRELGVRAVREGYSSGGRWVWALPGSPPQQSAPGPSRPNGSAHNGNVGVLCDAEAAQGVSDVAHNGVAAIERQAVGVGALPCDDFPSGTPASGQTRVLAQLLVDLGAAGIELAPGLADPAEVRHWPDALPPSLAIRLRHAESSVRAALRGEGIPDETDADNPGGSVMGERLGVAEDLGHATHPGSPAWLIAVGEALVESGEQHITR